MTRWLAIFDKDGSVVSFPSLRAMAEAKLDGHWSAEPSDVVHALEPDGLGNRRYVDCADDLAEEVLNIETQRLIDDADEYHHRQAMSGARL